jgi:fluoride exporter
VITATTWLAVALGGAVGAPARFVLDRWVTGRVSSAAGVGRFPWGLLVVNGLGSAIAGIVLATTTGDLRYLLLAGFCGGFTTFSGFAWEVDRLWSGARDVFWWAVFVVPVTCITLFLVAWRIASLTSG